jgi:hypothetical protein
MALDLQKGFHLRYETAEASFWPINKEMFDLENTDKALYHINSFE